MLHREAHRSILLAKAELSHRRAIVLTVIVFVKHGETYTTKYLHLNKRNVKKGQRVKQGQIIGEVGCTGLCTGPHLHYEFLVNGVHRNPRTIVKKLPKAKRLSSKYKADFLAVTQPVQIQLANYSSQLQLATRE